ncbi:MAG: aldo/keto reductase [Alphaproteobacteria bacterium]|nr:aldo/keto reductase [Alphaproteobacteria bacterium]
MTKETSNLGPRLSRKDFLKGSAAAAGVIAAGGIPGLLGGGAAHAATQIMRAIPRTGEKIPVIGVGTAWIYDVEPGDPKMPILKATLDTFVKSGGGVIDSSPTYGRAEPVVGQLLAELGARDKAFIATKISTFGEQEGIAQVEASMQRLRTTKFELLQVHNIKDTKTQLKTIRRLREEGKVKYIGITVSSKRRYERFIKVMESEPLDFVQVNYSLGQPDTAERILPLARDKGMAVLINRPFWKGRLFRKAKGKKLPDWAAEFDCKSWAQFFLKFSVGHPAVTAAIPGTDRPEYMVDNLAAGRGRMPDEKTRAKMLAYWQSL